MSPSVSAAPAVIQVRELHKSYGEIQAVKGVDLEVQQGEVFALLGPNGAGKTTLVEILEGHRKRTSGEIRVLGHDPGLREQRFRQKIGIVLQETGVEPFLTVAEAIELYRGYYPNARPLDEIIELVGLGEKRDDRVNRLSGGQRRRLDVAIGLAGDPELLFLDEPTTGFDPTARRNAWQLVENLAALGKTVFLTTHYMDEAHALANRVAILVAGKIVAQGSPRSLIQQDAGLTKVSFVLSGGLDVLPEKIRQSAKTLEGRIEIETTEPMPLLHHLTGWAIDRGLELAELRVQRPSLEDVYLNLTAEAERGSAQGKPPDRLRALSGKPDERKSDGPGAPGEQERSRAAGASP